MPKFPSSTSLPRFARAIVFATASLAVGASASAALVAQEAFNYTAGGTLNAQGAAGGGFSAAWVGSNGSIQAGGLSFSPLTSSGNFARTVPSERIGRALDMTIGGPFAAWLDGSNNIGLDGTVIYVSVLMRVSATTDFYALEFHRDGTGDGERFLQLGRENGIYGVRVQNDNARNVSIGTEDTATHLLVAKITFGISNADSVTVFLDPTPGGPEPGAGTTIANGGNLSFDQFSIANFGGTKTADFDEIRIGATFSDVTPVPEPATAAFLALGALLGATRRRKS